MPFWVANSSTSCPAWNPLLMLTTALLRVALSASVIVRPESMTTPGAFSVYWVEPEEVVTTGDWPAATLTLACTATAECAWPSHALTVNALRMPVAFAGGVQTHSSPAASSVPPSPGTTPLPFFVNVPLLTADTRKRIASPSTSCALAACARAAYGILKGVFSEAPHSVSIVVRVGGSLTGWTVMFTVPVAVRAPPAPLLPRSSTSMRKEAAPLKFWPARNFMPFSAALTLARVPVNPTVLPPLLPATTVKPERVASVTPPLAAVRVTLTAALPASTSAIVTALLYDDEKTKSVSSLTDWLPGRVTVGASLMLVTLMVNCFS